MSNYGPEWYYEQSVKAEKRGDMEQAIAWLNTAKVKSFGHKRRARYEARADKLAEQHSIERHNRYADDEEALTP